MIKRRLESILALVVSLMLGAAISLSAVQAGSLLGFSAGFRVGGGASHYGHFGHHPSFSQGQFGRRQSLSRGYSGYYYGQSYTSAGAIANYRVVEDAPQQNPWILLAEGQIQSVRRLFAREAEQFPSPKEVDESYKPAPMIRSMC